MDTKPAVFKLYFYFTSRK